MEQSPNPPKFVHGVVGAVVGGLIGFFAFKWILTQGFYALLIPPGLLGLGAGYAIRGRSLPFAIAWSVAAIGLELFTEWRFFPFEADGSFLFFLTHLHKRKPLTLVMLVIGPIIGFRLALGPDMSNPTADSGRSS